MVHPVVYVFEAKQKLIDWLIYTDPDFLECVRGPSAWIGHESDSSISSPDTRLTKMKILYFTWLLRSRDGLLDRLPVGSTASLSTFDEFWSSRRIEAEGDVEDLRCGAEKCAFNSFALTGDIDIDRWLKELRGSSVVAK